MTDNQPTKRGQFQMLIIGRDIVTIGRKWRSKWWVIHCTCKRRRKDGTCEHIRAVLERIDIKIGERTRIAKEKA